MAEPDASLVLTLDEIVEDDVEMMGAQEEAPAEGEGDAETNLPAIEPDVPVKVTFLEYEAPNLLHKIRIAYIELIRL
jgi:hypothetical protein